VIPTRTGATVYVPAVDTDLLAGNAEEPLPVAEAAAADAESDAVADELENLAIDVIELAPEPEALPVETALEPELVEVEAAPAEEAPEIIPAAEDVIEPVWPVDLDPVVETVAASAASEEIVEEVAELDSPDEVVVAPATAVAEEIPAFRIPVEEDEPLPQLNPAFQDAATVTAEVNAQYVAPQDPPAEEEDATDLALDELVNEVLNTTDAPASAAIGFNTPMAATPQPRAAGVSWSGSDVPEGKDALKNIKIDFYDTLGTPLDQALTLLIEPTGYNVIIDSSVGSNLVSLSFKDSRTDLKSALDLITRTYGLDYVVESGTIVVADKEKVHGQLIDFEYRVFTLSYADPMAVKQALVTTGLLGEDAVEIYGGEAAYAEVNGSTELSASTSSDSGGGVEVKRIESNLSSTPPNSLLVKAMPEAMPQIQDVINRLDRRPQTIQLSYTHLTLTTIYSV